MIRLLVRGGWRTGRWSGGRGRETGFLHAFEAREDPWSRTCPHPLDELVLVALCAITSSAENCVTGGRMQGMKLDWLRHWLPFANSIGPASAIDSALTHLAGSMPGCEAMFGGKRAVGDGSSPIGA